MNKCDICGFVTPGAEDWEGFTCANCGQEYRFDEGILPVLTDEQLKVLKYHWECKRDAGK